MLNRPIKVGDTVLAKGYASTYYEQHSVIKLNKKTVSIDIPSKGHYDRTAGKWVFRHPTSNREPSELIVVNEQLEYNKSQWPELYI